MLLVSCVELLPQLRRPRATQAGGVATPAAGLEFTPKPFLRVRFAEQRESVNRIAGGRSNTLCKQSSPAPGAPLGAQIDSRTKDAPLYPFIDTPPLQASAGPSALPRAGSPVNLGKAMLRVQPSVLSLPPPW